MKLLHCCKLPLLFSVTFLLSTGCQSKKEQSENRQIMVTIEPLRYFVNRIAGEAYTVETLVPEGTNPETYDPTPGQIVRLSESAIYFKAGRLGTEEMWKKSIAKTMKNGKIVDTSEGFEYEVADTHQFGHTDGSGHYHHSAGDPHTWSSVEGARTIAANMKKAFISVYPADSALFEKNYRSLAATIDSVETIIAELFLPLKQHSFMTYHPSLTYFAREFELEQLPIESEGKEPSPRQLKALISEAREEGVRIIFIQREFDRRQAEAIAIEAGCRVVEIAPSAYDWPANMVKIAKYIAE